MKKIYRSEFDLLGDNIVICSSDKGVCSFQHDIPTFKEVEWITGTDAELYNASYIEDMTKYAAGELNEFNWAFDLSGTKFQQQVWQALLTIPYGKTVAYSDIARQIDCPKAVRAVGGAIGKNPVLVSIPCHRVIGKNGKLTGFSSGLSLKRRLLDVEGITYYD